MLIALEGIDACGKATQAKILAERLKAKLFSFPAYETNFGKVIKAHLAGTWKAMLDVPGYHPIFGLVGQQLDATVLQALMLANRMELVPEIREAAANGHVVFDRYWLSAYAYGKADGLDGNWLLRIHEGLPQPDLQILLDLSVEKAAERQIARGRKADRYEAAGLDFMRKVRSNYKEVFLSSESRLRKPIVDASGAVAEVAARIWCEVEKWL